MTYDEYMSVHADVAKLLEGKLQLALTKLSKIRANNFHVQENQRLGVRSNETEHSDVGALERLNDVYILINFLNEVFMTEPSPERTRCSDYFICAKTILGYVEEELGRHVANSRQQDSNYMRELNQYQQDKKREEEEGYGFGSRLRHPESPNQTYASLLDRWRHIRQTVIEVFINRGIPQV